MGLILDLAVIAIATVVVGSLALLTWTLSVSTVHAVTRGRAHMASARSAVAAADARIRMAGHRARGLQGDHTIGTDTDTHGEHTDR